MRYHKSAWLSLNTARFLCHVAAVFKYTRPRLAEHIACTLKQKVHQKFGLKTSCQDTT